MEYSKKQKQISALLTIVQYLLLLLFVVFTPIVAKGILLQIIEFMGIGLGFWAIVEMLKSKLRISPIPDKNSILISSGPYKVIRHPMYSAIILTFLPLSISHPDLITISIFIATTISLYFKLNFEESLLKLHFQNWDEYSIKTKKIIPFIY